MKSNVSVITVYLCFLPCLNPAKCVLVCHSYFILYVIVLGFYKIHLFLFDHSTLSVVR